MLEDAIDCYLKYCSAKTRRGKRIFTEAAQWIFDRDDDWLFGFDNICEMLKLDPDYIRRVLKQSAQERLLNQPSGQQLPLRFPGNSIAFSILAVLPGSTNSCPDTRQVFVGLILF